MSCNLVERYLKLKNGTYCDMDIKQTMTVQGVPYLENCEQVTNAKDTISMKKTNEYFLPNARIADYTVEQWEIKLDKNISMENLVKLFPFIEDA